MNGEISGKVDVIKFSDDMVKPYGHVFTCHEVGVDMTFYMENNQCFDFCGPNDWGQLLADSLQDLMKYARAVRECIDDKIKEQGRPQVIVLGKNEYRALDIWSKICCGEKLESFKGFPVVRSTENDDGIILLGCEPELPFN